jgi:hypothetical protein
MTNKRTSRKRKANPLFSRQALVSRRIPRPIVKFDGHILEGTLTVPANITGSNIGLDYHTVDCHATVGIARNHNVICNSYEDYVYRKLIMEWIPKVGPADVNAGAQIAMAFYDNAENVFWVTQTATSTTIQTAVPSTRYPFIFNAWERVKWNVPLTRRRKDFAVNSAVGASVAEYERCTQGVVAVAITNTITSAIVLGSYRFYYEVELRSLASTPGT